MRFVDFAVVFDMIDTIDMIDIGCVCIRVNHLGSGVEGESERSNLSRKRDLAKMCGLD